jgi:predicted Rossmann fold flavoprotein
MDASRFWALAQETGESPDLYGNFLPGKTQEQARRWFMDQAACTPRRSLTKTLAQLVPERFAEALCLHIECDPPKAIAQLPRKDRDRLIEAFTKFRLPVKQDRGWNYAEVTAGGVPLEEINFRTMESKLVPGLYLIGEILDSDGRIGGFNFQWAWATGLLAGRAVSASVYADGEARR